MPYLKFSDAQLNRLIELSRSWKSASDAAQCNMNLPGVNYFALGGTFSGDRIRNWAEICADDSTSHMADLITRNQDFYYFDHTRKPEFELESIGLLTEAYQILTHPEDVFIQEAGGWDEGQQ